MAGMWLDPEGKERKVLPMGWILIAVGVAGLLIAGLSRISFGEFIGGALFAFAATSWLWLRLIINLVGTYQEVFLALKWDKVARESEEEAQNGDG